MKRRTLSFVRLSTSLTASLFFLLTTSTLADFRFRISEDLGSLDWGNGEVPRVVVQQLMEGLTTAGPRGEPLPALAASWRVSANGARLEFRLRSGAKWSDGEPVCAKHFVDAWLRVLSPTFASPYAHLLFDLKNGQRFHSGEERNPSRVGVTAKGCEILAVEFEKPVGYFPALASHWVLSPVRLDLLAKHGQAWMRPENLAVTGPYSLAEWKIDRHFVLKRNPLYSGTPAHEETLKAVVVQSDATALALFESGEIDWLPDLPFLDKPRLRSRSEYQAFPAFIGYHLGFNHAVGLSRDQRCALARAIDKQKIPHILQGGETPADTTIPPEMLRPAVPSTNAAKLKGAYDPSGAKKLWGSSAKRLEVHYYAKDIHGPLMEFVQQQWRENLGVIVQLHKTESRTYWSRLQLEPPELFLSGTTAAYAHPYSFLSEFLSSSRANWGRYKSRAYDAAAAKAALRPAGEPAAVESAAAAMKILLEQDCAVIPLYFRQSTSLLASGWRDLLVNPMSYVYLKGIRRR